MAEEGNGLLTEREEWERSVTLKANGIEEGQKVLIVPCKVVSFSPRSLAKAADYESVEGTEHVEPELTVHVPVFDPALKLAQDGAVGILREVYRQFATALDMEVVDVAHRRADRAIAERDTRQRTAARRVQAQREVKIETGEVL